jgi:shikimate kinase
MIFFLIGLPGCGKSTLGKKFAHVLNLPFYDLDHMIEAGEGARITELFSSLGESKFREIEQQYLEKTRSIQKAVIATGGGTPCFFNNMTLMNSLGMSVFLDVPPKEIALRLSENGISKRPILKGKTREEICVTLEHLRHVRLPFYTKSHITIVNPDIQFNEQLLAGFQK